MTGDDRTRHCARCDRQVLDLSQRTRAEVEALLAERTPKCARLFERGDGAIVLADCVIRRRKRVAAVVGVAAALAVAHQLPETVEAERAPVVEIEEIVDIDVAVSDTATELTDNQQAIEKARQDPSWRFTQIEGSFTGGVLASEALAEAIEAAFEPGHHGGLFENPDKSQP